MQTLRLKISDRIYEKLLLKLHEFDKNDLQIIKDNDNFQENKAYLEAELRKIESGSATMLGMDEAETILEKAIRKFEGLQNKDNKHD